MIDIWDQQDVMKLKQFDEMRISGKSVFIRKTRNQEQNPEITQYFDKEDIEKPSQNRATLRNNLKLKHRPSRGLYSRKWESKEI